MTASQESVASAVTIDAPKWSTIALFALLLFVAAGLIGLIVALMIVMVRARSKALSTSGPRRIEASEIIARDGAAPAAAAVFLVMDAIALAAGQYLGVLIDSIVANSVAGTQFPARNALGMLEARLYEVVPLVIIALGLMWIGGRYRRLVSHDFSVAPAVRAVFAVAGLEVMLQSLGARDLKLLQLCASWGAVIVLLHLGRGVGRALLVHFRILDDYVVLVGPTDSVSRVVESRGHRRGATVRVVSAPIERDHPEIGRLIDRLVAHVSGRSHIVLCPPPDAVPEALRALRRIEGEGIACSICCDFGAIGRDGLSEELSFSDGVLSLHGRLQTRRPMQQGFKWCMDQLGAVVGIVLFFPVFLLVALIVKLDGGPVVFAHERIGRYGRRFHCLKIRSMRQDAQAVLERLLAEDPLARAEWERDFKLRDDPRITRIGRFLRRTSLDEIPQFINVLRGEMSLVGPRPIVPRELRDYYEDDAAAYMSVKPGVTGLWQVSGRNDLSYPERVALDTEYARTWSLGTDVLIMLRTVEILVQRRGAY